MEGMAFEFFTANETVQRLMDEFSLVHSFKKLHGLLYEKGRKIQCGVNGFSVF